MPKFKLVALIVIIVGLGLYALPTFGASTADVDITVTVSTGPPVVETASVSDLTVDSFTANGNIVSVGGSVITRRGFCYIEGESGDPTTADTVVYEDGTFGAGTYSLPITGLTVNTHYRVRAYAVNSLDTGYGDTISVTTKIPSNTILITGTGVLIITGPSPFTTNITSIDISVNSTVDNINIEVDK